MAASRSTFSSNGSPRQQRSAAARPANRNKYAARKILEMLPIRYQAMRQSNLTPGDWWRILDP